MHVELVLMNCGVLLDGVALGAGVVPERAVVDSLVPLVRVVLGANEVHEAVEVDIVILRDDAERADDEVLEYVAVHSAVCRECVVLDSGAVLESRWGEVLAMSELTVRVVRTLRTTRF